MEPNLHFLPTFKPYTYRTDEINNSIYIKHILNTCITTLQYYG